MQRTPGGLRSRGAHCSSTPLACQHLSCPLFPQERARGAQAFLRPKSPHHHLPVRLAVARKRGRQSTPPRQACACAAVVSGGLIPVCTSRTVTSSLVTCTPIKYSRRPAQKVCVRCRRKRRPDSGLHKLNGYLKSCDLHTDKIQ